MPDIVHPIQRRYHAEDLVRQRGSGEQRRYVAPQRAARIDPNPHQIDAVMFALQRLDEGGCILADEVGLGKTIEAGLVIAQRLAEGAHRVLLLTPKALLGQWRQELYDLFGLDAAELRQGAVPPDAPVLMMGREQAGSDKGAALLGSLPPFDLCVIDEAHEVFAAIHRRFDRHGQYQPESKHARIAGRVRDYLRLSGTPVLLLTATPIQNSLTELWGLVHFVDPTQTLLGDLPTFRMLFCDSDARSLQDGQEDELRRRLERVCKRTLRRQAQEFLEKPFVDRQAKLFEYSMSAAERQLYADVTSYLLQPSLYAFRGNSRRLLLIGFHRRMASSKAALQKSLDRVADRLQALLDKQPDDGGSAANDFLDDLEDEAWEDSQSVGEQAPVDPVRLAAELARVRDLAARTRDLDTDSKAETLLQALRFVQQRAADGTGSGKLVIFTESIATQEYLRDLLIGSGLLGEDDVTLFRGDNSHLRAREALGRWKQEVGDKLPSHTRPSADIAVRMALVHEFRTRSQVFISTEAGAKGLNLQFCETLVNYDLPWNPQRIEQRIGRCHRYGQTRTVTAINFISRDNDAQRLTFEILSQKLDLFGTVLDASDSVLWEGDANSAEAVASLVGEHFEAEMRRIYERARTIEEIEEELRALRDQMQERRGEFDAIHERTAGLIESHLDSSVKTVFRRISAELPDALAELDRDLGTVSTQYLAALGVPYDRKDGDGHVRLTAAAHPDLPQALSEGIDVVIGKADTAQQEALHLSHPLVECAIEHSRRSSGTPLAVAVEAGDTALGAHRGQRGRMKIYRVRYHGYERLERLYVAAVLSPEHVLSDEQAQQLLSLPMRGVEAPSSSSVGDDVFDDIVEEHLFEQEREISQLDNVRFDGAISQLESYMDDRVRILERQQLSATARLDAASHTRDTAMGAQARTKAEQDVARHQGELSAIEVELARLRARDDDEYRRWCEQAHDKRYAKPQHDCLVDAELVIE